MLIDTRGHSSRDRRPAWEPNWRLCGWVAATIVLLVSANATFGLVAYVLFLAAVACACMAVSVILPPLDGLRDYRQ